MAAPVPMQIRSMVIKCVNMGKAKKLVAEMYFITIRVINKWLKLEKETGSYAPKAGYQKGCKHAVKEEELQAFKEVVDKNPDMSLKDLAKEWGRGSRSSMSRVIREQLEYTVKKKLMAIENAMKTPEKSIGS